VKGRSPYDKCPVYTSEHFSLRLVEEGDAEDMLCCYSDVSSVRLMNADNCTSDFYYTTLSEMKDCIQGWLKGYERGVPVCIRFSIIDTQNGKVIGTIEMYVKSRDIGVLRIDLCSAYETQNHIIELLQLSTGKFYDVYGVQHILTKAIPIATERIAALRACGFTPAEHHAMKPHGDYYIR